MTTRYSTWSLLAVSFFLVGCHDAASSGARPSDKTPQPTSVSLPMSPEERHKREIAKIKAGIPKTPSEAKILVRNRLDPKYKSDPINLVESAQAMEQILREEKVVGEPIDNLVSLLGQPDRKDGDAYIYTFDTGFMGSEWAFQISNNIIVKINKSSLE